MCSKVESRPQPPRCASGNPQFGKPLLFATREVQIRRGNLSHVLVAEIRPSQIDGFRATPLQVELLPLRDQAENEACGTTSWMIHCTRCSRMKLPLLTNDTVQVSIPTKSTIHNITLPRKQLCASDAAGRRLSTTTNTCDAPAFAILGGSTAEHSTRTRGYNKPKVTSVHIAAAWDSFLFVHALP